MCTQSLVHASMYTTVNPVFLSVYTIKLEVVEGYQRLEVVERDRVQTIVGMSSRGRFIVGVASLKKRSQS